MNIKEVANIAIKAGEILIKSGAEIYRVQETISNIFSSYNVKSESFVVLTGIIISAESEDNQTITLVKYISGSNIDLKKIEMVNSFSRTLKNNPLNYEEAMKKLEIIESIPIYPIYVRLLAAGITAFVYTILFNGKIYEAIIAFFISIVIYRVKGCFENMGLFLFFNYFVSCIIAGILCIVSTIILPYADIYKIAIGSVMILVPGLTITNGIKDALYGDTVSSLYRLTEAAFAAIAAASGIGIVFTAVLRYL